ncbi:MAG: hypothetical protein Kow00122_03240 [Thermoleophilia bacterium]
MTGRDTREITPATILVVDDENTIRNLYRRWLTGAGYETLEAAGGKEALEIFSRDPQGIDLVVLDMIMPDISGFHTFELIRARRADARVLLCSGYRIDRQAGIILEAGAVGFIQKPFGRETLLEAVGHALGSR